jgi:glycosyltransferase involved in cell wall biosynthesis
MAKTVFVNRYFYPDHSATSQLLSDLAFELARDNAEVHVVTSRQRYDDPDALLAATESCKGVHVHRLWTTRYGRANLLGRAVDYLTFYFSAAWCLWRMLRRDDVVVAKTDPPLISVVAMIVAKLRGATLINWVQDLFPEVAAALGVKAVHVGAPLLRWLRNLSLRAAANNVVLGERMAARLLGQGISPSAITIIHNWSDSDAIHPVAPHENVLRDEWNLNGKFVVGYSGNMGRAHEFETLIDAAEQLQEYVDIVFLFIGSGAQRPVVEEMVKERGLGNIIFKPYQLRERLALSLSVPDLHVISLKSELEGLIVPSKFYGIAAAGRPTLFIGDIEGEIPRIVRKHQCGVVAGIGDVAEVVREITAFAHHQPQSPLLQGENARRLFEKFFTQYCAFSAWRQVLRQQLGEV